ncbi:hypothetical protein J7360_13075 [Xanthomonas sp. D99]|nr:hypothetical protein [Xanthomonas sp. D-99]
MPDLIKASLRRAASVKATDTHIPTRTSGRRAMARAFASGGVESTDHTVAMPGGNRAIFGRLNACMEPPYYVLYLFNTSRGEAEPGRYQSPALERFDVKAFWSWFGAFLSADARHDLWAHLPTSQATAVWDRHNQ